METIFHLRFHGNNIFNNERRKGMKLKQENFANKATDWVPASI